MDIDTATRVWFENLRSMTDALDHLLAEKDALIASQARRIEELEARIADIATRIDRQVKASDGYAEEYARADDPRPTTWQIGNSHFTDLARELRALLNRGEG